MDCTEEPFIIIPPIADQFSVEVLQDHHYMQTLNVFIHAFCDDEPMTEYINMQYHEFKPFAERVTQKAVIEGMSSVVIEKKSKQVVALSLVEDLANPIVFNIPLTKKFDPIFNLLEQLSSDYFKLHPPVKNQIAHLFISAVAKQYRGLGLSTQTNFFAMQLAREHGFTLMLSELTNYINEKGILPYLKGRKECLGKIIYNEFIFENEKPFENLSGEAHAYLWDLPVLIKHKESNHSLRVTM